MRMLRRSALLLATALALVPGCAVATSPLLGVCGDGALCAGGAAGVSGDTGGGGAGIGAGAPSSAGVAVMAGSGALPPASGGAVAAGAAGTASTAGNGGGGGVSGSAGASGNAGAGGGGGAAQPALGDDITASAIPIALITMPTGGGNQDLEVLRDDDRPPVGNDESGRQYDTFTSDTQRSEDWLGYRFNGSRSLMRVVFQTGIMFPDGGWFDSIRVQVRNGGNWSDVPSVQTTPSYPGGEGESFATYQFDFAPITGDGIRIFGTPGGDARFVSCGELRVFEQQ